MISEEAKQILREQVDRKVCFLVQNFETQIKNRLTRLEGRLEELQDKFGDAIMATHDAMDELKKRVHFELVQEREDKILINQFTNVFLSECKMEEMISPVDFAFTRFAVNVAVFAEFEPPERMVSLPSFLCSILASKQDTVVGPSLLALVHLSLHHSLVPLIMEQDISTLLIHQIRTSQSNPVLIQAAKLLASLGIHQSNKVTLSSSGCIQALLSLIQQAGGKSSLYTQDFEVSLEVKEMALKALCNITEQSATNKNLLVEIGGLESILQFVDLTDHEGCILSGVKVIVNCMYGNEFNASSFFQHEGDSIFSRIIDSTNIQQSEELMHMLLMCVSNLANSQVNQIHVGSSPLIEHIVHILKFAKSPVVVKQAAIAVVAVCHSNQQNKIVLSSKKAITSLCHQAWEHAFKGNDEAVIWINHALHTVLLLKASQLEFCDCGGLEAFTRLCMELNEPKLLVSCLQVLSPLVPAPDDMIRLHDENTPIPIEHVPIQEAIKRVMTWAFDQETPPPWMIQMSQLLHSTDEELQDVQFEPLKESAMFIHLKEEVHVCIQADHQVTENPNLKGLIFSFY